MTTPTTAHRSPTPNRAIVREESPGRFTARMIAIPEVVAEGESEREALTRLREQLATYFSTAKVIDVDIELPVEDNPWLTAAGMLRDDPNLPQYLEEWARQPRDEEPSPASQ